ADPGGYLPLEDSKVQVIGPRPKMEGVHDLSATHVDLRQPDLEMQLLQDAEYLRQSADHVGASDADRELTAHRIRPRFDDYLLAGRAGRRIGPCPSADLLRRRRLAFQRALEILTQPVPAFDSIRARGPMIPDMERVEHDPVGPGGETRLEYVEPSGGQALGRHLTEPRSIRRDH